MSDKVVPDDNPDHEDGLQAAELRAHRDARLEGVVKTAFKAAMRERLRTLSDEWKDSSEWGSMLGRALINMMDESSPYNLHYDEASPVYSPTGIDFRSHLRGEKEKQAGLEELLRHMGLTDMFMARSRGGVSPIMEKLEELTTDRQIPTFLGEDGIDPVTQYCQDQEAVDSPLSVIYRGNGNMVVVVPTVHENLKFGLMYMDVRPLQAWSQEKGVHSLGGVVSRIFPMYFIDARISAVDNQTLRDNLENLVPGSTITPKQN